MHDTIKTILEESGYKIPPYRMNHMVKSATKIVEILFGSGPVSYTAKESQMILDLVKTMVEKAVEGYGT